MNNPVRNSGSQGPPETTARTRRLLTAAVASLVVLACVIAVVATNGKVTTDDAQVDGRLVPVAPKISGYVAELLVADNQWVSQGQVIARIERRDVQAVVDQTAAALRNAEAAAAAAEGEVLLTSRTVNSAISSAAANVAAAEAELVQARRIAAKARNADTALALANLAGSQAKYERSRADLARMRALAEKHEISQLQFDAYVAEELAAKSQMDAAQQSLAAQAEAAAIADAGVERAASRLRWTQSQLLDAQANRARVGIRADNAAAMRAVIGMARANSEQAGLQLTYTEIRAPRGGKVTRRTVEAGAYVTPGQTLVSIVPIRDLWVTANFKETQLRNVRPGDRAEVYVDQLGRRFGGHVDSIANATGSRLSLLPAENATGNFVKIVQRVPVKIVLDPSAFQDAQLGIGANVDATIFTRDAR